jgi:methyltransferase (TIGR00027 family)
MGLREPSMTMVAVSYARAKVCDDLEDKWSSRLIEFLPKTNYQEVFDNASRGMFSRSILVRSLFYESKLKTLANQYNQLIILSSGLDTRALQIKEWRNKAIFNVDHPFSHSLCKEIFNQAQIDDSGYRYVPYDLTKNTNELLRGLEEGGLNKDYSTLVLWEGSTFYLDPKYVCRIIEFLANEFSNVRLFFDFANWYYYTKNQDSNQFLKQKGEPWIGYYKPEELETEVKQLGFNSVRIIDRAHIEEEMLEVNLLKPETIFFAELIKIKDKEHRSLGYE